MMTMTMTMKKMTLGLLLNEEKADEAAVPVSADVRPKKKQKWKFKEANITFPVGANASTLFTDVSCL